MDDYVIGGKTGTSRTYLEGIGYSNDRFTTSFTGFIETSNGPIVGSVILWGAKGSRIKVDDSSLDILAAEFNQILGFIEQLNEVDVEGVEPMTSVSPQKLKRRVDQVSDGDQQERVLSNAPDAREGFFAVPKVVE